MNIDIEEAKIMLINKKSDLNYTKPREYILKALEQQQKLLNKIKVDLIKRADLKGDICVDLSDGIWMELCVLTAPPLKEG